MTDARATLDRAVVVLTVPGDPPVSQNRQERMHWMARRTYRADWRTAVAVAWANAGHPVFRDTVSVELRLYYRTQRRRDPDNAIGGCKPVIDGLVLCGCLADDNHLLLMLDPPVFGVDRDEPRLEIAIRDWSDA